MFNIYNHSFSTAFADAPAPYQFGMQDPATPIMEGIINLHHHIMFFMVLVCTFVGWMLFRTLTRWSAHTNSTPFVHATHHTTLEVVWTVLPSLILLSIGIPSFSLLYSMDEIIDPAITIKVIGRQWYWSYEYSDYITEDGGAIAFDSYMVPEEDLEEGQLRLLEVDNRIVVPANTHVRLLITAADVLHSWALPSAGIKLDAVPGRLNQTSVFFQREGVFYGQCSEICGVNHAFMPIVVEAVSLDKYVQWVAEQSE